jgi:hypothetical protein
MRVQVGSGPRRWIAGLIAMTALCWLIGGAWAPPDAAAQAKRLWRVCTVGSGAGQCSVPRGVVADPDSGHLFVADQANRRIVELTAWGSSSRPGGGG